MKTFLCFCLTAILILSGCSKSTDDLTINQNENQMKSAKVASPIAEWTKPAIWDNNNMLQTALWLPPPFGPALPNYSFTQFPDYNFSRYYIHGETEYNPANYDLMAHFGYISPEAVTGAVVEFTFPHIRYFVPHMNNKNQQRIYRVHHEDNKTVIKCTTDLVQGMNPMFCFLVKVDCGKWEKEDHEKGEKEDHGKGESGYTTFWTDMKVNGVSVKGTIKNKVFKCN
jgi:hypothetical protein